MNEPLSQAIRGIGNALRDGDFTNEAEVSSGVVRRLLAALDWPVYDTNVVIPEFAAGRMRVDYALCHPKREAVVLVEVKRPGGVKPDAEEQLFRYCVSVGVPIAVLTDGRMWHFFLPAGQGSYEERCFARLDLTADEGPELKRQLRRYLRYEEVKHGRSPHNAQQDLTRVRLERACARAWRRLVEAPANEFLTLFMQEVRNVAALDPAEADAAEWIRRRARKKPAPPPPPPPPDTPHGQGPGRKDPVVLGGGHWVSFHGQPTRVRKGIDVLVTAFTKLAEYDPSFCQRYGEQYQGRNKRRVARTPREIQPDDRDLRERCRRLPDGWWIDSNLSNKAKVRWIRQACEVAGVKFGQDLRINIPGTFEDPQ